jgi:hypothetical protein
MTLFASKGRGRPRKQGVPRDPRTGRIASGHDRQSPEAIKAVAEEARIRQLLGVDVYIAEKRRGRLEEARKRVSNPLLGSALGRFLHGEEIDRDQYEAGLWFAEIYRDMAIVRGWPIPNLKALDYGALPGRSTASDKSPEWVARRRKQWEGAMAAIYHANGDQGRSTGPIFEILKRVIVEDIGPSNAYELGNLRVGLNAINQARGV